MTVRRVEGAIENQLRTIVDSVLRSAPDQPFAFESLSAQLYDLLSPQPATTTPADINSSNWSPQLERDALQTIADGAQQYAFVAVLRIHQHSASKLEVLLQDLHQFLVAIQRLSSLCERLHRRVDWTAYNLRQSRLPPFGSMITDTAFAAIDRALRQNGDCIVKASKNVFDAWLADQDGDSCRRINFTLSKYAQYLFSIDRHLANGAESSLFAHFIQRPLLIAMKEYGKKQSIRLLQSVSVSSSNVEERKQKVTDANPVSVNHPDWNRYLDSVCHLWQSSLCPRLFVAFTHIIESDLPLYYLPLIRFTQNDRNSLCALRDSLIDATRAAYVTEMVENLISTLLDFITEEFISSINVAYLRQRAIKDNSHTTTNGNEAARCLSKCFRLIKSLYNILANGNDRHTCMAMLFRKLSHKFQVSLRSYLERCRRFNGSSASSKRSQASSSVIKAEQHLASVAFLCNFERALTCLFDRYLYRNAKLFDLARTEISALVNRDTDHDCANFSNCLAVFMHHDLSSAHSSDPDDYSKIDQAIRLFAYLADKHRFERHYRLCLRKRLLSPNVIFAEKERYVAVQLAIVHDVQYANQLETMLNDVLLTSARLSIKFRSTEAVSDRNSSRCALRINMLTSLFWNDSHCASIERKKHNQQPPPQASRCDNCYQYYLQYIPAEVQKAVQTFSRFYLKSHSRRLVRYCVKHSWAVVRMRRSRSDNQPQSDHKVSDQLASSQIADIHNSHPRHHDDDDDDGGNRILVTALQLMILQFVLGDASNGARQTPKSGATFRALKNAFNKHFDEHELNRAVRLLLYYGLLKRRACAQAIKQTRKVGQHYFDEDIFHYQPLAPDNIAQNGSGGKQICLLPPSSSSSSTSSSSTGCTDVTTMRIGSSLEAFEKMQENSFSKGKKKSLHDDGPGGAGAGAGGNDLRDEMLSDIEYDRRHSNAIMCAIVRIAKRHGSLSLDSLIAEMNDELGQRYKRFHIPAKCIDRQIQQLIKLELIALEQSNTLLVDAVKKRTNIIRFLPA